MSSPKPPEVVMLEGIVRSQEALIRSLDEEVTLLRARLGQARGAVTYDVLECDRRPTPMGEARYVRIHRKDKAPMGFRELWEVFERYYPACWAVQVFPPRAHLLDQAHKYHLFVYTEPLTSLDLMVAAPKGTVSIVQQRTSE